MQQTAAVLMNAVAWHYHTRDGGTAQDRHAPEAKGGRAASDRSCAAQISFGQSDTLVGRSLGRLNRGKAWHEWALIEKPAFLVLSAGAHIYGLEHNFTTMLREVDAQLAILKPRLPNLRVWWKTQQPGGCGPTPLATPPDRHFWKASKAAHGKCTSPSCAYNGQGGTLYNWPSMLDYDRTAATFWSERPASVSLLDVRALHLRPDAHVGTAVNISHDCLHYCLGSGGVLDELLPQAMLHALVTPPAGLGILGVK